MKANGDVSRGTRHGGIRCSRRPASEKNHAPLGLAGQIRPEQGPLPADVTDKGCHRYASSGAGGSRGLVCRQGASPSGSDSGKPKPQEPEAFQTPQLLQVPKCHHSPRLRRGDRLCGDVTPPHRAPPHHPLRPCATTGDIQRIAAPETRRLRSPHRRRLAALPLADGASLRISE